MKLPDTIIVMWAQLQMKGYEYGKRWALKDYKKYTKNGRNLWKAQKAWARYIDYFNKIEEIEDRVGYKIFCYYTN